MDRPQPGVGGSDNASLQFVCVRGDVALRLSEIQQRLRRGFRAQYPGGRTLFSSVLIGAGAAVLGTLLNSRFGTGESMGEMVSTETGAMWFIVLALTISPFEELYYRGFVFPVLQETIGAGWSVAVVSIWFCLLHVSQLAGDWVGVPIILAMSFIWTFQRHFYRSLLPSLACHWTYNLCTVALPLLANSSALLSS